MMILNKWLSKFCSRCDKSTLNWRFPANIFDDEFKEYEDDNQLRISLEREMYIQEQI